MQRGAIFGVVLVASGNGGNNRYYQASTAGPRRITNGAGWVQNRGRASSPSKVTGGKAGVPGARGCHFRRRFYRSSDSSYKTKSSTSRRYGKCVSVMVTDCSRCSFLLLSQSYRSFSLIRMLHIYRELSLSQISLKSNSEWLTSVRHGH